MMNTLKASIAALLIFLPLITHDMTAQGRGTVEGIDRTQRPAPEPPPEIAFPHFETFTLDNGLKVFLVQDPRPSVTMRLLVGGGNVWDGDKTGLADAVADLLTKGVEGLSASEFADKIDFIGGTVSAGASADAINVVSTGLKRHMPEVLDLFVKAIVSPTYPQDELEKYKSLQISGLKASKKEGDFLATYAVNKVLYGERPIGKMPSEESFQSITRDDIMRYHSTFFSPNNSSLAVVGDLKPGELKAMLNKAFKSWKPGPEFLPKVPEVPDAEGGRVILVDRPTAVQSLVRVVGPGPSYTDPDRTRAFLLNSVLGGGTGLGNRLAMNLRETHAYTYTPYSYFTANKMGGYSVAAADVRNSVTDSAIVQMIYEFNKLGTEAIPGEELDLNIKSAVGNYLMSLANPTTTAIRVQSIDYYGLPQDYYDKLVQIYTTTTSKEMMDLARKYYNRNNMNIVVVGKASEVKEKLEEFGTVEVWDEDLQPVNQMSAEDLGITAEEAWSKMLDAMGGKKQLQQVKTLSMEGAAQLSFGPNQAEGTFRYTQAAPNKSFQEITVSGMPLMQQFVDGEKVVVVQQGQKMEAPPEEAEAAIARSEMLSEARIDELGGTLSLNGTKSVEGSDTYVIGLDIPKAGTELYYIDQKTFLPVQQVSEGSTVRFSNWQTVGAGIKRPISMTVSIGGSVEIKIPNLSYTVNGTVDDKIFQAP